MYCSWKSYQKCLQIPNRHRCNKVQVEEQMIQRPKDNGGLKTTQQTTHWTTGSLLKTDIELRWSGKISNHALIYIMAVCFIYDGAFVFWVIENVQFINNLHRIGIWWTVLNEMEKNSIFVITGLKLPLYHNSMWL